MGPSAGIKAAAGVGGPSSTGSIGNGIWDMIDDPCEGHVVSKGSS